MIRCLVLVMLMAAAVVSLAAGGDGDFVAAFALGIFAGMFISEYLPPDIVVEPEEDW